MRPPDAGAGAGEFNEAAQRTASGPVSSVTVVEPQPAMNVASDVASHIPTKAGRREAVSPDEVKKIAAILLRQVATALRGA
jgi:hypothetical protein